MKNYNYVFVDVIFMRRAGNVEHMSLSSCPIFNEWTSRFLFRWQFNCSSPPVDVSACPPGCHHVNPPLYPLVSTDHPAHIVVQLRALVPSEMHPWPVETPAAKPSTLYSCPECSISVHCSRNRSHTPAVDISSCHPLLPLVFIDKPGALCALLVCHICYINTLIHACCV